MKKALCLPNGMGYKDVTVGKIYDVISIDIDVVGGIDGMYTNINIINDDGIEGKYYIHSPFDKDVFKDVTTMYRNEIINDILDYEKG